MRQCWYPAFLSHTHKVFRLCELAFDLLLGSDSVLKMRNDLGPVPISVEIAHTSTGNISTALKRKEFGPVPTGVYIAHTSTGNIQHSIEDEKRS